MSARPATKPAAFTVLCLPRRQDLPTLSEYHKNCRKPVASAAIPAARPVGSTLSPTGSATRTTGFTETTQAIVRPSTCQLRQECKGWHQTCHLHRRTPKTARPATSSATKPAARPVAYTTMPATTPADFAARPVNSDPKPTGSATRTASSAKIAWPSKRPVTSTVLCLLRR
ncbi:hypothetical protein TIFTF001_048336 [Ficus carica]|uniref:Uncharacterized protein n=1 Tax=Ficus carica TaxID=3494 RepID=A0AA88CTD7_FICCA|nr:hypothetical protein TIFTF001_048326 [Ficus carica]GMN34237.1 hypothetical protein TIFTF001_048336 [Ficus carica]